MDITDELFLPQDRCAVTIPSQVGLKTLRREFSIPS